MQVFISHAATDAKLAERVAHVLREAGFSGMRPKYFLATTGERSFRGPPRVRSHGGLIDAELSAFSEPQP